MDWLAFAGVDMIVDAAGLICGSRRECVRHVAWKMKE